VGQKSINPLLFIGLIGTLTIGASFLTSLYQVFWGETDIWWTHREMRLSIEETKSRFELFIAGAPLQKRLSEGTLFVADVDGAPYRVVAADVNARLNNWETVKTSILKSAAMSGFLSGISIALLAVGLFQVFAARKKSC
jgi:hypothetical protein